jgi:hypothetical protein
VGCILQHHRITHCKQVPCGKATNKPRYQTSTTRQAGERCSPPGPGPDVARHNNTGQRQQLKSGCSRTAPHTLFCSFSTKPLQLCTTRQSVYFIQVPSCTSCDHELRMIGAGLASSADCT